MRTRSAIILSVLLLLFFSVRNAGSDQLLPNPDFESWTEYLGVLTPDGWITTAALDSTTAMRSTQAHSGNYSIQLSQNGLVFGSFSLAQAVGVVGGSTYYFEIWTRNLLGVGYFWFVQLNNDTTIAFDTLSVPISLFWKKSVRAIDTKPEAAYMTLGATVLVGSIVFDDGGLEGLPPGVAEGMNVEARPPTLALLDNQPNPFNYHTNIRYEIPASGRASVRVYDLAGRITRILLDGYVEEPGIYTIDWDAKDAGGNQVPSGTYFCRLTDGQSSDTRRLVVLR
jgi:hypothetical protein